VRRLARFDHAGIPAGRPTLTSSICLPNVESTHSWFATRFATQRIRTGWYAVIRGGRRMGQSAWSAGFRGYWVTRNNTCPSGLGPGARKGVQVRVLSRAPSVDLERSLEDTCGGHGRGGGCYSICLPNGSEPGSGVACDARCRVSFRRRSCRLFRLTEIIHSMKVKAPPLLPILGSDVQARLLTALLLDPERELSVSALADISETSVPTAVREVDRAEEAGIVRSRNVGRTRLITANTRSFAYEPLRELLLRAFGPLAVVTDEFAGLDGVDKLLIFGSWQRGTPVTAATSHATSTCSSSERRTAHQHTAPRSARTASCIARCR